MADGSESQLVDQYLVEAVSALFGTLPQFAVHFSRDSSNGVLYQRLFPHAYMIASSAGTGAHAPSEAVDGAPAASISRTSPPATS